MRHDFDVLIVGGGLIGASLACAVAGHGLRTGLIESRPFSNSNHPSYDDRCLALAYGSQRIFTALGVWPKLATTPILNIHIGERGLPGAVRINHWQERVEALGYVVEARSLGAVLLEQLTQQPDIELFCPASVESVVLRSDAVHCDLSTDNRQLTLTASLLVAADGGHSQIRSQLGIDVLQREYQQHAIIANISPELPHRNTAYERFNESGPLALLPMSDNRCSLVYTVASDDCEKILALNDEAFLAQIRQRFGAYLGDFVKTGQRSAYPLQLLKTREHDRPRLVIIGNAAHTLHPIAGQGFNLGLRDVAALAEVIIDSRQAQQDIGNSESLKRYSVWRRSDQQQAVWLTDGLARLFSNKHLPLKCARGCGLTLFDLLPAAKHSLARQTMGISGTLPRLVRGLTLASD